MPTRGCALVATQEVGLGVPRNQVWGDRRLRQLPGAAGRHAAAREIREFRLARWLLITVVMTNSNKRLRVRKETVVRLGAAELAGRVLIRVTATTLIVALGACDFTAQCSS
jgi:hypothetical protein